MYEALDACNYEPLMPASPTRKNGASLYQNQFIETSICIAISGNKGLAAVKNHNEPHLITSKQAPTYSECQTPDIHFSGPFSISPIAMNPNSNQCHIGSPEYLINSQTFKRHTHNFNESSSEYPTQTNNENLNFNYMGNTDQQTFSAPNNTFNTNNAVEEDEFESVINPRSKSIPQPGRSEINSNLNPTPIYIDPFSCSPQTNSYVQEEPNMLLIPTFSIDLINDYSYLTQDTDDAFASVLYSNPSQLKPVLCTPPPQTQFYTDNPNYYNNSNNYEFNSNICNQTNSSFTPFFQSSHFGDFHEQSISNKNSYFSSKSKSRSTGNEYKRYKSPAILISQSTTQANPVSNEPLNLPMKNNNSISTISVTTDKRTRTRKVSSSPSLTRPTRNSASNSTDINIEDKKPVINFKKPTISSSNNNEKMLSQNENRKHESISKNKIRGRR